MKITSDRDASWPSLGFGIKAGEVKELPKKEELPEGVDLKEAHEAILSMSYISEASGTTATPQVSKPEAEAKAEDKKV